MQRINIHNWYIYSLGLHLIYIEEQPQHLIISLWILKHLLTQVFQRVRYLASTSLSHIIQNQAVMNQKWDDEVMH